MAHANTGSGKTAAFMLPIIQQIVDHKRKTGMHIDFERSGQPLALVLAPTRDLCQQHYEEAKAYALSMLRSEKLALLSLFLILTLPLPILLLLF